MVSGIALKCFRKRKIGLERESNKINTAKYSFLLKLVMAFLVLFSFCVFGIFHNTKLKVRTRGRVRAASRLRCFYKSRNRCLLLFSFNGSEESGL